MTQEQEVLTAQLSVQRIERGLYLHQVIGSGQCDGTKLDLLNTVPGGAMVVRIGNASYIIDTESFARFAVSEEQKRLTAERA